MADFNINQFLNNSLRQQQIRNAVINQRAAGTQPSQLSQPAASPKPAIPQPQIVQQTQNHL